MNSDTAIERLNTYLHGEYSVVKGYSSSIHLSILLPLIQRFQYEKSISGDVGEIGVHHGRFFFALDSLRHPGDRALVADVFSEQHLNIDKSGLGDREIFEDNLSRISHDPTTVFIYQGDSLSCDFRRVLRDGDYKFRLFSIDGGHTVTHALNDLLTIDNCMVNGGVILLDDFMNSAFPGVSEAVFKYLDRSPRFIPVCTIANKLVLVSVGYAQDYRFFFKRHIEATGRFRARPTLISGSESLYIVRLDG